jgi:hypothetical protein
MIGNARGGEETWNTAYKNLIETHDADLAICFGKSNTKDNCSLYKNSKYVWEIEEYNNWRTYYEQYLNGFWEKSLRLGIHNGLMGAIDNFSGSAPIQFAIKHFLLTNYLNILLKYKKIIITRSDHYYITQDKIKDNNYIWIPDGENYGGICDRHIELNTKHIVDILDVFSFIDSKLGFGLLEKHRATNPESVLNIMYRYKNLPIKRYPRTQFTVATTTDTTRWQKGVMALPQNQNLLIKYINEYRMALKNLNE